MRGPLPFLLLPLAILASPFARADFQFSGSGSSGFLVDQNQPWSYNEGWSNTTGLNYWHSYGTYDLDPTEKAIATYGFEITFSGGGPIDLPSLALGNTGGYCFEDAFGPNGTAFCSVAHHGGVGYLLGPDSVLFTTTLGYQDADYFSTVFFDGATPTSFTGTWYTEPLTLPPPVATPEPGSLLLVGTGLLVAGYGLRKRLLGPSRA